MSSEATPARAGCSLCGLRLRNDPLTGRFGESVESFCCLGCLNVYTILVESGLVADGVDLRETELYRRSLSLGLISTPDAKPSSPPESTDVREVVLHVGGMWCTSCGWLIEHALSKEPGVVSAEVYFNSDLVNVKYCPQYMPADRIDARIRSLGYTTGEPAHSGDQSDAEMRDLLLRTGIAGFLWLNIMTLSVVLYVGYFERISESFRRGVPFVLMALATPVVFYSAYPIMRLAWRGIAARTVGMESLLGLGILAAYVYSSIQAFTGAEHVYFDTASAIVTLVLIGKIIERGAKQRTTRALSTLYGLMPTKARLLDDGRERFVAAEHLIAGDVFVVKAGERIPADGEVVEGTSHVDESLLTGESRPVEKEPGDSVIAGSVNAGTVLQVRATHVGGDSTVANIIRLVESALRSRSALERTVDRVARVFVPAVILIAVLTFVGAWLAGSSTAGEAIMRAITVLVIACPCALGMATPLAITTAIGAAARRGVIVSDVGVLEKIRGVDVVLFDKTGTITEGEFSVREVALASALVATATAGVEQSGGGPRVAADVDVALRHAWLASVAALERYSEHPLGRAVVRAAEAEGVAIGRAESVEVRKGQGIVGRVGASRMFVGNRRLVELEGARIEAGLEDRAAGWERDGLTVCWFGSDGVVEGAIGLGDHVRPEAPAVVGELQRRGIGVVVVSGDARATTARVAAAVGVDDFVAEASPEDKVAVVEKYQSRGAVVAFVGDGVNDAPALARAELGVSMGSGADVAATAASLVIMGSSLDRVLVAFDIARRTRRVVRQNLFWAFAYNAVGISLAVAGVLTPIVAAGAMLLSSLSVITNSRRLGR